MVGSAEFHRMTGACTGNVRRWRQKLHRASERLQAAVRARWAELQPARLEHGERRRRGR